MVEINNQRKAFWICWRGRRELIPTPKTPEIMVMTSQAESYLPITRITLKLVTLNPKLKSMPDATSFFPLRMPTASSLPERLLSEKSGRCGIAADYSAWRFTYD